MLVKESNKNKLTIKYQEYDLDLYYDIIVTKEDIELKNKQMASLKQSIERRKQLLANEGYLNKAPRELIEKERETLKEEENKLLLLEKN